MWCVYFLELSQGELYVGSTNDLKRRSLKKRGYITTDIVTGDSKMRAEQRFYDRFTATQSLSPA